VIVVRRGRQGQFIRLEEYAKVKITLLISVSKTTVLPIRIDIEDGTYDIIIASGVICK
jgi:hypothetical protein